MECNLGSQGPGRMPGMCSPQPIRHISSGWVFMITGLMNGTTFFWHKVKHLVSNTHVYSSNTICIVQIVLFWRYLSSVPLWCLAGLSQHTWMHGTILLKWIVLLSTWWHMYRALHCFTCLDGLQKSFSTFKCYIKWAKLFSALMCSFHVHGTWCCYGARPLHGIMDAPHLMHHALLCSSVWKWRLVNQPVYETNATSSELCISAP